MTMHLQVSFGDAFLERVLTTPVRRSAKIATVINRATLIHDLSIAQVTGQKRFADYVRCRALIVFALRTLRPDLSYPQIARYLGGRDHSTIINLHRKAVILRATDPEFLDECQELIGYFNGGNPWQQ